MPPGGRPPARDAHEGPLSAARQQEIAALGLALSLIALWIGLSGPTDAGAAVRAVAESLTIAVPIAVGLYALRRDRADRFARLLVIAGFAWAPTALALSDASIPYSIGRAWGWMQEAALIYLLLALPLGRLTSR